MALRIKGVTVSDLTEAHVETINPDPVGPLMVPALSAVSGWLTWPDYDFEGRAAVVAALADALSTKYGAAGQMASGMGVPESPEHPLLGHFTWTLDTPHLG